MKRLLKTVMPLFILLLLLCGCDKGEFCNAELFAERYGRLSGRKIGVEDFVGSVFENQKVYLFEAACEDKIKTAVKLFSDSEGRLSECRVIMSKLDENGKPLLLTEKSKAAFAESSKTAACAFSGASESEVEEFFEKHLDLEALEKEKASEKTAELGEQRFIYLSNQAVTEVVILNRWLSPAPETQKPESRAVYDKTTNVRTQTVPHK